MCFLSDWSSYDPKKYPTQSKGGTLGRASILLQLFMRFARKFSLSQSLSQLVVVEATVFETCASVVKNEVLFPLVLKRIAEHEQK